MSLESHVEIQFTRMTNSSTERRNYVNILENNNWNLEERSMRFFRKILSEVTRQM